MGEQFSASAFGGNRFPDHEFMIERLPGRVKHEGFSRENLKTRRFDRLGVCNSKTLAATQGREWNHPKHSNLHRKSQIRSSSTRWPIEPHLWVLKGRKQSGNKQVSCGHFRRWQEFSRSSLHTPSPLSPQKPMRVSTSDPSLDAPLSSSPPDRESPGAVCSCSFLRWFTQTRRGRDALAVPGDRDSGDPCDRVELTGSSSNLDGFPEPPRDDGAPGCDGDDRDDLRTTGGDSDDDDDDDDDDDEVRNDPPGDGSLRNPGAGSGAPVEMDASGVGSDADADADADAPADREADADGVSSVLCKNVDALYRKRFLDAMERGIINLVLSGVAFLDPSENKACKNMTCVKKLAKARMNGIKIKMEDTIDQKTTILVMTTASNNKEEASIRSFKALKCSLLDDFGNATYGRTR
ncbi:unnamed protein product [Pseudo-nitzschia multistriata]|uniref:Uncharacterized protein n=1 Tax=Pseudo-nitzschia multistriata TaxID=183589 RepID=A0A448Z0Y6_9STRA|nr:unnamed protein product [Pseudo-nitzschia multistriata]